MVSRAIKKPTRRHRRRMPKGRRLYMSKRSFGFPRAINVKLKTTQSFALSAAALTQYALYANSANDPLGTHASSVQPQGHDQFTAMYHKYRVNACKIACRWFPDTSGVGGTAGVSILASPKNTQPASLLEASELGGTKFFTSPGLGAVSARPMKHFAQMHKVMGVNKQTYKESKFSAVEGFDPGDLIYWLVSVGSADGTTVVDGTLWITLTQYITYFERKVVNDA